MKAQNSIWVNSTTIEKGSELVIKKQMYDYTFNQNCFLYKVVSGKNKGFEFWAGSYIIKPYKFDPIEFIYVCLADYINAGWDESKLLNAGLVPDDCKPYLKQFLKYKNLLLN
jgi:hypothetical protein